MNLPEFSSDFLSQINNNLRILQNSNIDNYRKLDAIYNESEKINDFLRPYFSCHPGCSYCCKYDVLITSFEANYIAKKIGKFLKNDKFSLKNNTYCPFLKDKICSIYKYRPLICRTYHVYGNPKDCEIDYNDYKPKIIEQYGTKNGGLGNQVFREFGRFIDCVNSKMFNGEIKDIRNYF